MKSNSIPRHFMESDVFFTLEKIENADNFFFRETHRHDFFEVLWFFEVSDQDFHCIDFEKYIIENNQIYILTPNQAHQMDIGKKKGYVITFSPDFFNSLSDFPAKLLFEPFFFKDVLQDHVSEVLKKLINLTELEYRKGKRRKIIQAYCSAFLLHLSSLYELKFVSNHDRASHLLKLIENNYKTEKEVNFYAHQLALSVRRLNEISVVNTGKTVKQLVVDRLIIEAKRFIAVPTLTISEIAYLLNFNEPAYFTRLFKQKTGLTPLEFRKKINR